MKSRPMIFQSDSVLGILADQKTMTRRVVKGLTPEHQYNGFLHILNDKKMSGEAWFSLKPHKALNTSSLYIKCPYGVVGDRIWVRETWAFDDVDQKVSSENSTIFKADFLGDSKNQRWRSAMFMPRAASRIELEITGIRVERLQDISETDAIAEGVEQGYGLRHVGFYQDIWDSINGKKYPWSSNPWVWVVEFKRVEVQP